MEAQVSLTVAFSSPAFFVSNFSLDNTSLWQGFSKFTFKGPNRNYHQRQKVRNNCYYKTCFYKHAYYFI